MWILMSSLLLAAEPNWAGVPLTKVAALQLQDVELSSAGSLWQASDAHQGWVKLRWYPTVDAAKVDFQFQAVAATTIPQPALVLSGADEAQGDGAAWVMARSRNVIVFVRSQDAQAATRARSVLAALQPEGTVASPAPGVDAATWDAFGRRLSDLGR